MQANIWLTHISILFHFIPNCYPKSEGGGGINWCLPANLPTLLSISFDFVSNLSWFSFPPYSFTHCYILLTRVTRAWLGPNLGLTQGMSGVSHCTSPKLTPDVAEFQTAFHNGSTNPLVSLKAWAKGPWINCEFFFGTNFIDHKHHYIRNVGWFSACNHISNRYQIL